jgi:hypothetical protein
MALGEYEEAKDCLERARKIRSRVYGELKLFENISTKQTSEKLFNRIIGYIPVYEYLCSKIQSLPDPNTQQ